MVQSTDSPTSYPTKFPSESPTAAARIFAICADGAEHTLVVDIDVDTVLDVKVRVALKCGIPLDDLLVELVRSDTGEPTQCDESGAECELFTPVRCNDECDESSLAEEGIARLNTQARDTPPPRRSSDRCITLTHYH